MKKLIVLLFFLAFSTIAKSQHWEDVGGGTDSLGHTVFATFEFNNELYVSGWFGSVASGTLPSEGLALWNGNNWLAGNTVFTLGTGRTFSKYQGALHMGGDFKRINGNTYCNKIARLDSSSWVPLGSGVTNGEVRAMSSYNGDLYIGGNFTIVDSTIIARRIARWDGTLWHAIGNGFTGGFGDVFDMTVYQNQLYVVGDFTSIDGIPVSRICSWDGNSWNSLNGGTNGLVFSLFNDTTANRLYVGGIFTQAGGVSTPTGVAYWDGSNWYPVGTNPFIPALNLYVFNGILYNGTTQSQAVNSNNDTLRYITWFDGTNWNPMSGGLDGTCHTFETFDNELYLGGTFTHAGDSLVNGIAKWIPGSLGADEISEDNVRLTVKPNPAKDEVILEMNLKKGMSLNLCVTDVNGKNIFSEVIVGNGTIIHKTNTSEFTSGIYMFSIYEDKKLLGCEKVVIQR